MAAEGPTGSDHWTVNVFIDHHDGRTHAKARLFWHDREWVSFGSARCSPADRDISDIGDELAVARALHDLAGQLLVVTSRDIQASTCQPVTCLHP